jgi:hypothetical protein
MHRSLSRRLPSGDSAIAAQKAGLISHKLLDAGAALGRYSKTKTGNVAEAVEDPTRPGVRYLHHNGYVCRALAAVAAGQKGNGFILVWGSLTGTCYLRSPRPACPIGPCPRARS